jgi:two-component system, sensor histidine kinase and response regulator
METLRVVVTDDELGMRKAVGRALEGFVVRIPDVNGEITFSVSEAETGEEALEIIERDPPDILLLDHKMPGISGLEVLSRVSQMTTDMLTIMITAYASIETAVTATKQGAYDFLAKPFTPEELKGTIRKAATRVVLGKQARKLAEEKRQVRFEFIRVLGHELRAPLNAVDGYLEILKNQELGPNLAPYLEMIDRSIDRIDGMRKLIADLLDMTHIESGKRTRQLAPLDLCDVAGAALEGIRPEAERANLSLALDAEGPVPLTADRSEIEMIFNNLLSNAVKYNRPAGRIDVRLRREADRAVIGVSDTGIGLSPEESQRLFGEFVRIQNAQTAGILGSGLGLSIVRKLAELYRGQATVSSQPGQGSTFTVTLSDAPTVP